MKQTLNLSRFFVVTLTSIGSLVGVANAAVNVTSLGENKYLADIGTITFNVSQDGRARIVTVEDFYTGPNTDTSSVPLSSSIEYSINGATAVGLPLTSSSGSYGATFGLWDPNDFVFGFGANEFDVSEDDTITFTGSFTFEAEGLTSPAPPADDLTTYLSDQSNTNVLATGTTSSAIPEPSSALLLLGLGAFGLVVFRRKKN